MTKDFADCLCDDDYSCTNHDDIHELAWLAYYSASPKVPDLGDWGVYEGRNRYKAGEYDV